MSLFPSARWLVRVFALAFTLLAPSALQAQMPAYPPGVSAWGWEVTHNRLLAYGALQPAELARAALEKKLAVQRTWTSSTVKFQTGSAMYNALMTYGKLLRTIRMVRQVKNAATGLMDPKTLVYAVMPSLTLTAPTAVTNEAGQQVIQEREVGVIGFVPHEAQAHWKASDFKAGSSYFPGDDPILDKKGGNFINLVYPHSLADLDTFAFGSMNSPYMENDPGDFVGSEVDEISNSITTLLAHTQELVLSTAARIAGYGVSSTNTGRDVTRLDGSKATAYDGRLSPEQVQIQVEDLQVRAGEFLDRLVNAYVANGMDADRAAARVETDTKYFSGLTQGLSGTQNDGLTFAMGTQADLMRTIAEMENKSVRSKAAQQDASLTHLGKKWDAAASKWVDPANPDNGFDLLAMLDKAINFWPHGDKARLQAKGLSARYSHDAFLEMKALRNIIATKEKFEIAMDGLNQQAKQRRELDKLGAKLSLSGMSSTIDYYNKNMPLPPANVTQGMLASQVNFNAQP
jgi:hypothetical protein